MSRTRRSFPIYLLCSLALATAGCASKHAPVQAAENVVLKDFMGAWYVIGYTPLFVDKTAHNAVEHYYLNDNGKVETTYQFRKGSLDGELKTYQPTGFVPNPETPAKWQMQFIWPFKSDYIIFHLSADGQQTIVVHPNRKYAWIMQRSPEMESEDYTRLMGLLKSADFRTENIQRMPQDWSQEPERKAKIEKVGNKAPLAPR